MRKITITLESPPDREKLVASILVGSEQFCELNTETETLVVEFYPRNNGEAWQLSYSELIVALAAAKERLGV